MKAVLTFDMDTAEGRTAHYNAVNGHKYRELVKFIDNELTDGVKFSDKYSDSYDTYSNLQDDLRGTAASLEIDIN